MQDKPGKASSPSKNPRKGSEYIPIKEVLQQSCDDIVIPRAEAVNVGVEEKNFAHFFHPVEVQSFDDLQELSLVPKGLDEKMVQKAIAGDDAEALSVAREYLNFRAEACECGNRQNIEAVPLKLSYRSSLRTIFNGVRKTHNVHLSRLLSDLHGVEIESDGLMPAIVHGWIKRLSTLKVIPLLVFRPNDITIMHNATLNLSSSTNLLWANDIRIHVGGRLNLNSSYIKVRCASVKGDIA